jgi:hypothetical protein
VTPISASPSLNDFKSRTDVATDDNRCDSALEAAGADEAVTDALAPVAVAFFT